jgi:acetamidase/formamidase/AraC-like DNA-binding protein
MGGGCALLHKGGSGAVKTWSFTTESYPDYRRLDAWRDALGRLSIETRGRHTAALFGTAQALESPLGILFAQISSEPQELSYGDDRESMWLTLQLEGKAILSEAGRASQIATGDLIYGAAGAAADFQFDTNFRQLLVRFPRAAVSTRLVAPWSPKVGRISGRDGLGRIFGRLLTSVVDTFGSLDSEEMRPIEIALSEFLATGLAVDHSIDSLAGAAGSRAATLHRICQQIETRLSDPELSSAQIIGAEGISVRYLQKLFESVGSSFGKYVRLRRLERCRSDLINPLYAHLPISDICFRWGFNDSAHFSRAFRERFGASPRAYRRAIGEQMSERAPLGRGWPPEIDAPAKQRRTDRLIARPAARPLIGLRAQSAKALRGPAHDAARSSRHHIRVSDQTVHWGYFSRSLEPILEVDSGDVVTIETLTQHATDDHERMVEGDAGAESVFHWTRERKNVDRRGAGPMEASVYGRGAGEGFGVHICTGPVAIRGAEPGDVIEVRILDIHPRPSASSRFSGRSFGSNAATWWGFHYGELLTEPNPREVITIYEIACEDGEDVARAVYNFPWTPQIDPFGVVHPTIDYPGVPVDHGTVVERHGILRDVRIPLRAHFGVIGLAPREAGIVDSIPPNYFGGNIDNWRAGKGTKMYLPVAVSGGLFSVGDPHASQGDAELCGTAIECSLTGDFQLMLHKRQELAGTALEDINYPLLETPQEWIIHGFSHANYLAELGDKAQSEIYKKSSLDQAMKDAFRKARRFLMTAKNFSEDEAISLLSVGVDFGITQVVDGNLGVHAIIRKCLFPSKADAALPARRSPAR